MPVNEAPFSGECQGEYWAKLDYHKRAEIASQSQHTLTTTLQINEEA